MTKRDVASLVLKLTAVYVLISFLNYIPMLILSVTSLMRSGGPDLWIFMIVAIAISVIYMRICFLIISKSDNIATRLISVDDDCTINTTLSKNDVATIAFCCIGLLVLVNSIPDLIGYAFTFIKIKRMNSYATPSVRIDYTRLITIGAKATIGLALFLQAKNLTQLWQKLHGNKDSQQS